VITNLWEAADFVRRLHTQFRFGKLSRAPLTLLRFEVRGELVECEWMVRPMDPWDEALPRDIGLRNQTLQALQDALALRELLFEILSAAQTAKFRAYRQSSGGSTELVITGNSSRKDETPLRVASTAMRAKLCGLHFSLDDGVLQPLSAKGRNFEFAT
jgi:hypothetical protein